jgi:hypothetical protein
MTTWPGVSMRRVCRVLKFSRARLRACAVIAAAPPRFDEVLAERIQRLIERHPTFGYRRLWAMLRFVEGIRVNRNAVYRLLLLKGWFVHRRSQTGGPASAKHSIKNHEQHSVLAFDDILDNYNAQEGRHWDGLLSSALVQKSPVMSPPRRHYWLSPKLSP